MISMPSPTHRRGGSRDLEFRGGTRPSGYLGRHRPAATADRGAACGTRDLHDHAGGTFGGTARHERSGPASRPPSPAAEDRIGVRSASLRPALGTRVRAHRRSGRGERAQGARSTIGRSVDRGGGACPRTASLHQESSRSRRSGAPARDSRGLNETGGTGTESDRSTCTSDTLVAEAADGSGLTIDAGNDDPSSVTFLLIAVRPGIRPFSANALTPPIDWPTATGRRRRSGRRRSRQEALHAGPPTTAGQG